MDDNVFSFRNLIVWQKAMQLTILVYAEVKKFPSEERYALGDQLRRAVVSISSNIAEGAGRSSNKDYAHFLAIARGSLYETMTQLQTAEMLNFIKVPQSIVDLAIEIARMLGAMLKKYGAVHSSTSTRDLDSNIHSSTSTRDFDSNIHSSTSTRDLDSNTHSSTSTRDLDSNTHSSTSTRDLDSNIHSSTSTRDLDSNIHSSTSTRDFDSNIHSSTSTRDLDSNIHSSTSTRDFD